MGNKLPMMGIPVTSHCHIFENNKSALHITSTVDSNSKKKLQSISYLFVRDGSATDEWWIAYMNMQDNEADHLTRLMLSGEKRKCFVCTLLHHTFGPAS